MNKLLAAGIIAVLFPIIALAEVTPSDVVAKMQAGDVQTAEMFTRQILRDHPNSAKAHYYLGQILATEGNYKGAYAELNKAADLDKTLTFAASPERFRREMDKVKVNLGRAEAPPTSNVKDEGWSWFTWLMIFGLGGSAVWFFLFRKPEEKEAEEDKHPARNHPSYTASPNRPTPGYGSGTPSSQQSSYQAPRPASAPPQRAYAAPSAPHVVNNYNSGNGGLVEGMILGSMLSGGHGSSNVTNNNTTIIDRETTNNTVSNNGFDAGREDRSSSNRFDSGSDDDSKSGFDSGSSDGFDSGSDSSSFDSGSSSFDNGSSSCGDW